MKKYPLLILILISVALMTALGLVGRAGKLLTGKASDVNIKVPAAVDTVYEVKLLASRYAERDEGDDAKEEMLQMARQKQEKAAPAPKVEKTETEPPKTPEASEEEPPRVYDTDSGEQAGSEEESSEKPSEEPSEESLEEPSEESPEESEEEEEDGTEAEEKDYGRWGNPAEPDFQTVGEDYFLDACFIGDSRTQGFGLYSGVETTVYAKQGLQLYRVFKDKVVPSPAGKLTIPEALSSGVQFQKIYLMFGLNEIGWGDNDMFCDEYYDLIDVIKAVQPDAVIYVQQIIHVSAAKDRDSSVFTNARIDARNEAIREMAANEHVYYLELNEVFSDENNCLPAGYASDGIHLSAKYMSVWKDYLLTHAILPKE